MESVCGGLFALRRSVAVYVRKRICFEALRVEMTEEAQGGSQTAHVCSVCTIFALVLDSLTNSEVFLHFLTLVLFQTFITFVVEVSKNMSCLYSTHVDIVVLDTLTTFSACCYSNTLCGWFVT